MQTEHQHAYKCYITWSTCDTTTNTLYDNEREKTQYHVSEHVPE